MPNSFPSQRLPKCMIPNSDEIKSKMCPQNMEIDQETVTTGFKIQCLNTTLRFVKDDTQLVLKYPEMTIPQGEFVYSLIRQAKKTNVETDVGFGYKTLYAPLLEAMKIFGLKYKFKGSYAETSKSTTNVIFEKVPKQIKNENNTDINPTTTPNIINTNDSDKLLMTKPRKGIARIQNIIDNTPQKFQTTTLQAILVFIEDKLRAGMILYSLTEPEAAFCIEIIRLAKLKQNYFTLSEDSLLLMRKISAALCSVKDVRADLGKIDKITKLRVVRFEKIPNSSTKHQNITYNGHDSRDSSVSSIPRDRSIDADASYHSVSTSSETTTPSKSKSRAQKRQVKRQNIIDRVSESFIISALQAILDFSTDELNASLVFNNVPLHEAKFYRKIMRFAKGKGQWGKLEFPERCMDMLNELETSLMSLKERNLSVSLMETKISKHTNTRNVKFIKIPAYQNGPVNSNGPSELQNGSVVSKRSVISDSLRDVSISRDTSSRKSLTVKVSNTPRDKSTSKDTRCVSQNVNVKNGGDKNKRNSNSTIDKKDRAKSREKGVNNRNLKMLEAMSVPVQSDKAMKMMLSMGWEGGALGLRGEGITEPIIPALDLVSRAGLGHVKTTPNKTRKNNFDNNARTDLLQTILQLLESEIPAIVLNYTEKICTKELSFLKHVIHSFNIRAKVGLEFEKEKDIVRRIFEHMKSKLNLHLSYIKTDDDKNITLKKETISGLSKLVKRQEFVQNYPKPTIAEVAMQSRLTILLQILQFVKSDKSETNVQFECALTRRQRKYIEDCITKINQRNKIGITQSENDLFQEIADSMGTCYLDMNFDTDKMFILQKKYYKNRFYNSAVDALPHINDSTHAISEPNNNVKDINKNDSADQIVKDGDLLVLEYDESPIMISDDENLDEDLLNSSTNLNYAARDKTLPVNVDIKAEQELDRDIKDLEDAIMEADLSDNENMEIKKKEPAGENDFKKESSPSSKRSRSHSESSDNPLIKKYKTQLEAKTISIVPVNYPEEKITREKASKIQKSIATSIDNTQELPLLKCHGIKNGALVYSCYSEKSICFLKNVVKDASNIKITEEVKIDEKHKYKMSLKINSFIEENEVNLFKRLEKYNPGLGTKDWFVRRKEINCDFFVILVDLDDKSFEFIRDSSFSLFAGIDKAEFSVVWE